MSRTKPIGWNDLTEEVQETAIRTLMKRRHASRDEAQEAVDGAAARLIERQAIPLNAQALLITTATHALLDERQRQSRYRQIDKSSENGSTEEPSPWDPAIPDPLTEHLENEDRARSLEKVRAAMESLTESDRQRLKTVYEDGQTAASIDKREGSRPGSTKLKVHRARRRLQRLISSQKEKACQGKS